jgi:acyl-coenzyme A thioesterase PaaI-like protein
MKENIQSKLMRTLFNFYPCFRRTGGKISYISSNTRNVEVVIKLNWKTKNYIGSIYGGSMYGAVDPIYMIMLIKNLGTRYSVIDKSASINYLRKAKSTLTAKFYLSDAELDEIKSQLSNKNSIDRVYKIELINETGVKCAEIEKTINIKIK